MSSRSSPSAAVTEDCCCLKEASSSLSQTKMAAISQARTSSGVERFSVSEPKASTSGIPTQKAERMERYLKQWQDNWDRISGEKLG